MCAEVYISGIGDRVEVVRDTIGAFGVFNMLEYYSSTNAYRRIESRINRGLEVYVWSGAKLKNLDKIGRPYSKTEVYFGKHKNFYYSYEFLMRMVRAVSRLSHCSRKYALKYGKFYISSFDKLLLFTVNWEIYGILAPHYLIGGKKDE